MEAIEYVLFGTLVLGNFALGLYFSVRKPPAGAASASTAEDVFLGSRLLKFLPLAASSVASLFSSTGLIAFPAHYYAYGMHVAWCAVTALLYVPLAMYVFAPVLYKSGVTSIFEYIRLRFNAVISLTTCVIYIFLTQSIGAISILAASLTLVTVFKAPLFWSIACMGLSGTIYTALGGLRGVVWTDCMQIVIVLVAPTAFIFKIVVDCLSPNSTIQPLADFQLKKYVADFTLDFTNDENVWSCLWGTSALAIYRLSLDQVVVQRQLACRTLREAKRTVFTGAILLVLMYTGTCSMGFALIVWFRGCDPALLGEITSIDQIVPYYIKNYLVKIPGFSGLFLAGVVSAAISTVSSIINSQAAILYVDIIARHFKAREEQVLWITRVSAVFLGSTMTICSGLFVYMGSLTRVFMMAYGAFAAPYAGMCILAVLFPFVHSKGAGTATLLVAIYQVCHLTLTIQSGAHPERMPVSLEYCPKNIMNRISMTNATSYAEVTRPDNRFLLFRLSYHWASFFAIIATIVIGVLVSAITGEIASKRESRELSSDVFVRMFRKPKHLHPGEQSQALMESFRSLSRDVPVEDVDFVNRDMQTSA
ncbi:sodium-coupled monocarboxylate transporter 1-like [Haemaphysalis longicornis]